MDKFESVRLKSSEDFLRDVGITLDNFLDIAQKISNYIKVQKEKRPMTKRGLKPRMSIENQLLLTIYYMRHYITYIRLGEEFNISESYANKIFHKITDILIKILKLKSRNELLNSELGTLLIDASEQPIERPKNKQKNYYSGTKKRHTVKIQLVVSLTGLVILSVICCKGSVHDFKLLKDSRLPIHPEITKTLDSGYQGIAKIYKNCEIPIKSTKKRPLSREDKKHNRKLAKQRIFVENVIRRIKIFRICKEIYRGKHKNYGKIWNIIAGFVNLRYSI